MYAVIKTGGKQYRIASGEKLKIEQIPADIGQEITLDQVLSVGEGDQLKIGTPLVAGAVVKATVLAHLGTIALQESPTGGLRIRIQVPVS
jgi:large subunit ribosomal protein L21